MPAGHLVVLVQAPYVSFGLRSVSVGRGNPRGINSVVSSTSDMTSHMGKTRTNGAKKDN